MIQFEVSLKINNMMNRFNFYVSLIALSIGMLSCSKDDETTPTPEPTPVTSVTTVSGDVGANTTWKATDKILLKGFVYVPKGAVLTIAPGTVIRGDKDTKATLIVEPGGKIIAEGTKEKPIVFTSNKPVGQRNYGDWGGIVICGKADVNAPKAMTIEGGPRTKYGKGAGFDIDNTDNSGVLKYVRIEFSGVEYATDNEINGLTLGGVGSGTSIDYVQVSYCGDDSFEWFGGTVNAKHLIAHRGWDDEFDADNGYSGKLQFVIGLRDPNVADKSKSNGFESDNDSSGSSNSPFTSPTFSNVSLFGPYKSLSNIVPPTGGSSTGSFQAAMHLRRNTQLRVWNSVFAGWPMGLFIDNEKGNSQENATEGKLKVANCVLAGMKANYKTAAFDSVYFNTSTLNNTTLATTDLLKVENGFSLTAPKFALQAGSPLAAKTNLFTTLTDSFFDKVDYIGAFGTTDWTIGWANFDPQNTKYWE